jgi:hypothetical protein
MYEAQLMTIRHESIRSLKNATHNVADKIEYYAMLQIIDLL